MRQYGITSSLLTAAAARWRLARMALFDTAGERQELDKLVMRLRRLRHPV